MSAQNNTGLKTSENFSVGLLKIIKKYRPDSFQAIKNDIENHEFILSCEFAGDEENFKKIINCYDDLIKSGYAAELYEHGRLSSISFFKRWYRTMQDIDIEDGEYFD